MTVVVAVLAFFLPKWLFDMHDSRVFGKQEQVKLEMASYEKTGSLEEQIRSIALCSRRDDFTISAVRMDEGAAAPSDEEVAQIVFQEMDKLVDLGVVDVFEQMQRAALVERELYTAYITSPINNAYGARDAITFWKLRYQWNDQWNEGGLPYTLEVILDMEYHKVYDIKISGEQYSKMYDEYMSMPVKKREGFLADDYVMDNLINYYGISEKAYLADIYRDKGSGTYETKANSVSLYDSNESSSAVGNESEMRIAVEQPEPSYRLVGCVQFMQDAEKSESNSTELLLLIEYGMDEGQGFMHIGIDGLRELL